LWHRFVITIAFIIFAAFAQRIVNRRETAREDLHEAEERFRSLSEAAFEGIAITEGGKLLEVNDPFAAMFGYEPQEMIGIDALEIIASESQNLVRRNIASGHGELYQAVGMKKDGSRFDLEVHGKTSTYRDRGVRVTAVRDITERKRAEEAMRESEDRLRLALEGGSLGMWYLDLQSGEFYASPQAKVMHGLSPEDQLDNEGALEAVYQDDREAVAREIERAISERGPYRAEYRVVWPDGALRWLRARGRVYDRDGGEGRLIGVVRDVTQSKRVEEDLRKSEGRARAIADTATDAIITMTSDGFIRSFNPAAEHIFGYAADEVIDQPLRILMPERFRGSHEKG